MAMRSHVLRFMQKHHLFPESGTVILSLSAGVDSRVLLEMCIWLKEKGHLYKLKGLHVNHNTRRECRKEQRWLEQLAMSYGIELTCESFDGNTDNFEHRARQFRYEKLEAMAGVDDRIFTAHHLDDSYEWSLLSGSKSSNVESNLGIPLTRGKIARPLMCLSKDQIRTYAEHTGVHYFEDSSNRDLGQERNYLRNVVIPKIRAKHPRYLKHYVARSNQMAYKLGVHRLQKVVATDYLVHKKSLCGSWLLNLEGKRGVEAIRPMLTKLVAKHSYSGRGSVSGQLDKIDRAMQSGKWGPLHFSGGVEVHLLGGQLLIVNKKKKEYYRRMDDQIYDQLRALDSGIPAAQLKLSDLQKRLERPDKGTLFPGLVISRTSIQNIPSLSRVHSLLPKTTRYLREQKIWFQSALNLLRLGKKSTYLKRSTLDLQFLEDILPGTAAHLQKGSQ